MPFADDPLADDDLLAELRDACPEPPAQLLDPQTPTNQAILRSILAPDPPAVRRNGRRRRKFVRRVVVGLAAAAAITVGVVVTWPFDPAEPSAADVVHEAAAASGQALDSGRAEVTVEVETTQDPSADELDLPPGYDDLEEIWAEGSGTDTYDYRFAGDDVSVQIRLGSDREDAGITGERRVVDGEMYWHVGPDPSTPWFHIVDDGADRSDWAGDPRSLFATLEPRAGFELVGDETVDDVAVRHLRARTPTYFSAENLGLGQVGDQVQGPVEELEIWVDDDNVVRRIELETSSSGTGIIGLGDGPEGIEYTITTVNRVTVRFTDFGVPNDIEVPPTVCGLTEDDYSAGITAPPGTPPPGTPPPC